MHPIQKAFITELLFNLVLSYLLAFLKANKSEVHDQHKYNILDKFDHDLLIPYRNTHTHLQFSYVLGQKAQVLDTS